MIAAARERAKRSRAAIEFRVADAQALPFPDARFDIVFSFGSAKHWPDPLKEFGECWRVLKPGGELLVADATSDATLEEVGSFYSIAGFPRVCKSPIAAILYPKKFRPARPVALNKEIADQFGMPPGTVGRVRAMPAFLFRTRKPAA